MRRSDTRPGSERPQVVEMVSNASPYRARRRCGHAELTSYARGGAMLLGMA
jgi:hypothetical protein